MGISKSGKPLTIFGQTDQATIDQIENCLQSDQAVAGALMGDSHLGYSMPIGGVVAYDDAISPTGVGFDIACGNMAVKTNLSASDLWQSGLDKIGRGTARTDYPSPVECVKPIMREIQKKISFGLGRVNDDPIDHKLFDDEIWKEISYAFGPGLRQKAQAQLGTVGSGNHYVDLLVDTSGRVWVANHFGSRGLGHTIASGFMAKAAGKDFTDRIPETEDAVVLSASQGLGSFYVEAMNLAGRYAYAGREYVIQTVLDILGAEAVETVHNHHNFAWKENGLWIVRKGATPLTREPAFIGGSMGDNSVIVRGKTVAIESLDASGNRRVGGYVVENLGNLGSAPHGAGRTMSRTKAAGKMRTKRNDAGKKIRYRDKTTAAIDWDAVRADLTARGIVVLGAGADEAPGVYKDLTTVLEAHSNIEVVESLRPIGVVMAGADEEDPYKD